MPKATYTNAQGTTFTGLFKTPRKVSDLSHWHKIASKVVGNTIAYNLAEAWVTKESIIFKYPGPSVLVIDRKYPYQLSGEHQ